MTGDWTTFTLFCEDVRPELAGSASLVGVMNDNLEVSGLPAVLPKLVTYTRVIFPTDMRVTDCHVELRVNGHPIGPKTDFAPELIEQSRETAVRHRAPTYGVIGTLGMTNFAINQDVVIEAWVKTDAIERLSGFVSIFGPS